MNYYAVTNIVIVLINLPMAILLFFGSKGKKASIKLGFLCMAAVIWGFGSYKYSTTPTRDVAIFWWQIANVGSIFSTVTFYYFILAYLEIKKRLLSIIVNFATILVLYLNFFVKDIFVGNLDFIFNQFYYISWPNDKITPYAIYYLFFYFGLLFYTFYLLLKDYIKTAGVRRLQMKYLIIGMGIGFIGCHACFVPVFRYKVYPYLSILIAFYTIPIYYAIIKYRLMDIRLAITKVSIFAFVYMLVLGIPFLLSYKYGRPNQALWLMLILATAGPYIYTFLRRQAEKRLLEKQISYQNTLKQASYGIGRIKELELLVKLMNRILLRSVGIERCATYLIDHLEEEPIYNLKNKSNSLPPRITITPEILDTFKKHSKPFIIEEMVYNNQNDTRIKDMLDFLKTFKSEIVIPIVQSDKLLSLVLLGKKKDRSIYTNDDLTVFTILASQAGLAIENCLFMEAEKERLEREGASARRESLDMLVSTMAHEIDNPIQGAIGKAAMIEEILRFFRHDFPQETIDEINQHAKDMMNNCMRVSRIVKAVEDYSKRETGEFKEVHINAVMIPYHSLVPMIQKRHKEVKYSENIEENLPPVWGEDIMIEEILMNMVENAYHAVIHNEGEKKVHLHIFKKDNDFIRIEVKDNGYGIAPKIKNQLFQVPTTTKGSSEGTGIGLYRIRQICELLKAKYGAESEGRGHGALVYVEIPICKEKVQPKETEQTE